MNTAELAYVAGIIDTQAVIRIRPAGETMLPMVALHGANIAMLSYVARLTGTKVTTVKRGYDRAGCSEHCPERHQHIISNSGRWSVSGAKATVMLAALRPYLQLQGYAADQALEVGMRAPKKDATAGKMAALGWPLPEGWSAVVEAA